MKKAISIIAAVFFVLIFLNIGYNLRRSNPASTLSYSAFSKAVDDRGFQKATIIMGDDVADLKLTARDGSNERANAVPKQDLPHLIKQIMNNGGQVEFTEARRFNAAAFVLDIVPMILLIVAVFYISFLIRGRQA